MSKLSEAMQRVEFVNETKVNRDGIISKGSYVPRVNVYPTEITGVNLVVSNDMSVIALEYPITGGRVLHTLNDCGEVAIHCLGRDYLANIEDKFITCRLGTQSKDISLDIILTVLKECPKLKTLSMGTYQTPDRKIRFGVVDNTIYYSSSTGVKYSNELELTEKFRSWGVGSVQHVDTIMCVDKDEHLSDPTKIRIVGTTIANPKLIMYHKFHTVKLNGSKGDIIVKYNPLDKAFEVNLCGAGYTRRELSGFGASIARAYDIGDKVHFMFIEFHTVDYMMRLSREMKGIDDGVERVEVAVDAEETKPHMSNFATIELPPEDLPVFVNFTDVDVTIIGHSVEAYRDGMSYKEIDGVILDFEDPNWAFGAINKLLSEGIRKIYYVKGSKVLRYNVEDHIDSIEEYSRSSSRSQRRSYGFDDNNRRRRFGRE